MPRSDSLPRASWRLLCQCSGQLFRSNRRDCELDQSARYSLHVRIEPCVALGLRPSRPPHKGEGKAPGYDDVCSQATSGIPLSPVGRGSPCGACGLFDQRMGGLAQQGRRGTNSNLSTVIASGAKQATHESQACAETAVTQAPHGPLLDGTAARARAAQKKPR